MKTKLLCALLALALGAPSVSGAADYYKVTVTRAAQDLYKVEGTGIYVKTRYCYEYAYSVEAILQIDSTSGYNVGSITFTGSGGTKCDVEKLIK